MGLLGIRSIIVAAVVISLAIFLNQPPPNMSKSLLEWVHTGKYFNYNGFNIFYKDNIGRNEGPVLVCLHGFPSFSYDWYKVMPALQQKFGRVITPDFLGYGFSAKPHYYNYTLVEQADIIEAILQSLNVDKVHLLAHDYGDSVAQELLYRYNSRVTEKKGGLLIQSVCLLNGGMFPETNFPRMSQKILLVPYLGALASRLTFFRAFKRGFGEVFGPQTQLSDEEFQDYWAGIRMNEGHTISPNLLQYISERRINRDRWVEAMQNPQAPIHTIYGPADPVNPPGFISHYRKIIPNPSLAVLSEHIGHYPQVEAPKETMQEYFKFLKTLPFK